MHQSGDFFCFPKKNLRPHGALLTRFYPQKAIVTENDTVPSLMRACAFPDISAREMMASTLRARNRLDPTPCRNRFKNLRLSTARRRFRKKSSHWRAFLKWCVFREKKIPFCYKSGFRWAEFPSITNIKFLLTLYIRHKEKKLSELTKWSLKWKMLWSVSKFS